MADRRLLPGDHLKVSRRAIISPSLLIRLTAFSLSWGSEGEGREPRCHILIRGQSGFMLLYGSEGRACCVACLWQAVYRFTSLTDKLGSESRPPMMADISL